MNITNLTREKLVRGNTLPIRISADSGIAPLTGETFVISAFRESDGLQFDFTDNIFRITPAIPTASLSEVAGIDGVYEVSIDLGTLTEPDRIFFTVSHVSGIKYFSVDVENRVDLVSDLAVHYALADEKFIFLTTLNSVTGLLDSDDAEPTLTVFGADGTQIFEALYTDFTETNGVFAYEYSGLGIVKGSWVAVLRFDAFGISVITEVSFNVG